MSLLSFRAAVRLGAPRLVGRRETLSMFFAVGAALSGLSALPGWLPQGQPVFLGVAAAAAAAGIAWATRLPDRLNPRAGRVRQLAYRRDGVGRRGGMPSAAFASVSIFGTIYTASFHFAGSGTAEALALYRDGFTPRTDGDLPRTFLTVTCALKSGAT